MKVRNGEEVPSNVRSTATSLLTLRLVQLSNPSMYLRTLLLDHSKWRSGARHILGRRNVEY